MHFVFEWLVQKIYDYPYLSVGVFSGFSLLIAVLAFLQFHRAWKIFHSKRALIKEIREKIPPSSE